eukprot:CAMPEP_0194043608 /NCGR_PEP_ID=MMETSP0009_2-20130614/15204_1 /TAXON_ID=210454 /ORGANISM="Grammatophora oceanica, Strain CCMP 410" /LENGTH=41 /DNA_ID= /DNA_START= /DNA_END= /DNA_ORIENTATION=
MTTHDPVVIPVEACVSCSKVASVNSTISPNTLRGVNHKVNN